jgi:flagellar basal body-associated protein FliL
MRESDTQSLKGEMDRLSDEGGEFSPEEERFTVNESDGEEDDGTESVPREEGSHITERNYKGKRWLLLCSALGLCLLVGVGYLFLKNEWLAVTSNQYEGDPQSSILAIPEDRLLVFHSFVIPFHEDKGFTYISFSISFNVPNKELKEEMIGKKSQLRGIIYDIVTQEINRIKKVPSLEVLKEVILRGVNTVLSSARVDEVYITKFVAV